MSNFDPSRPFTVVPPPTEEKEERGFDPSRPFTVAGVNEEERTRTRAADIARGMGAGVVGLGQGVAELGALGLDTLLDTDYSRPTTDFFVGAKDAMGLDPETGAGKAAEAITNFGVAFVPIAGWLGRAGQVAQGARAIGQGGRFSRSAEAFGASGAGRALVGNRARLAGTTTLAAGVSDFFVSPEGMGTLADAFDALPEIMRSEEDTGLTGRDEAFRRLRNKIRVGTEGAAFGAAFEALFPAARLTARAAAQIPGVPTAAGTILRGLEVMGDKLSQIPGAQKYFTSRGLSPQELSYGIESAEAMTRTARTEAEQSLLAFEKAAKDLAPNILEKLRGGGRAGYDKLYDDLFLYFQGADDVLEAYGPSLVKPAAQMRDQITRLSTTISDQVANSNLEPAMKAQILETFENNMGGYIRRLYKKFENPETWTVDAGMTRSPVFKRAVDDVQRVFEDMDRARVRQGELIEVRPADVVRADAEQEVKRLVGLDAMNTGLSDDAVLALRGSKVAEGQRQIAGRPLYNIAEGLLQERSRLLDRSPSLRELLGEIKDPKQAYLRTVDDMSRVIAGNKLYDQTLRQFGKTGEEALQMLNGSQGRAIPLVVYGPDAERVGEELARSRGYVRLGEPRSDTVFGGSYGQMTGAYVAPEIYAALTTPQQMTQGFLNEALALALQAKGAAQAAKTVYSPITQVRNFISGAFLTMANGNMMRGMPFWDSLHLTAGKSANLADADFRQLYELTGNLGLRDQNITVNEFRNLLREGSDLSVAGKVESLGRTVMERVPFARSLERLYSGSDTFWKITNWNAERAKYANAFRRAGLAPDALDQIGDSLVRSGLGTRTSELTGTASYLDTLAGDIVKNTQPIYSRVPEAVKMVRRVPVVGNFVAFPAEVMRNTANILDQGLREMSFRAGDDLVARVGPEAAQRLEREVRAIGAQRLSGYLASAIAVPAGIQAAAARTLGWDQEGGPTIQDLQKIAPEYMKGHQLVPISEAGNPNVEFIDLSYMMPYDFVSAPVRAAMQLYSEQGDVGASQASQIRAAAFAGLGKLFEPFAGESLVGERLANVFVRGGQTPEGSSIFTQDTPFGEKISRGFNHVAGAYIPGALELFVQERRGELRPGRVTRAATGVPSPAGQMYDAYEEGAALVTGLRPMQARLNDTFNYRGFEYNQSRRNATSVFSQAANANDTTERDVIRAYERANNQLRDSQSRLYDLVETGRRLGMSDRAIRQQLVDVAQLGRREVGRIMRGQFDPLGVSDERVKSVLREGRTQARVIPQLPTRELRALEREYRRERLVPRDFTEPTTSGFDPSRPFTPAVPPAPQTQRAAPAAPVVGPVPAPAAPQPPQAPARAAPPSPSLLGSDPVSQARNAEIAQRLSNQ
jgi:hypothetical protein